MSAEAPAPERARSSLRFSARDLVGVAIFAVIFIVVTYAIGMLGVISPLTWLVVVPTATLANGVTFMLFVTRVRHAGMITLLALVIALFYLLTGNSVLSTIGIMAVGALADLVAFLGRYRSRRGVPLVLLRLRAEFVHAVHPAAGQPGGVLQRRGLEDDGGGLHESGGCAAQRSGGRRDGVRLRGRRIRWWAVRLGHATEALVRAGLA
ncbi:MAG: MptD family putative ECF transporter S component [Micropruina sp.]